VLKRATLIVAALAAAGIAFGVVLPRIASYSTIWTRVSGLSAGWIAALLAAVVVNVVTFAPPWMIALPDLGLLDTLKLTQASTAVTLVVPGGATIGIAASYRMLRSWGVARSAVTRAVAVTGIWNQLSTFFFPVVGVVLVATEGKGGSAFRVVAAIAGALFVAGVGLSIAAFRVRAATRWACRIATVAGSAWRRLRRRPPVEVTRADLDRFRDETVGLVGSTWPTLTVATLANQLSSFALLDLSLRAVGIGLGTLSVADSFTAWGAGRVIASLPLTPGGLGFVELGLTGTLIGLGGPQAPVLAAVLLYRVVSIVPTLLLGLVATLTWRSRNA
jgi:uncharacterized membrane protein YbhN (UPF0104 family)